MEFTEREKEILTLMIKMMSLVADTNKADELMTPNELFDIAEKLGIDY